MSRETISFFVPSEFTLENIFTTVIIIGLTIALITYVIKYLDLKKNFDKKVEVIRLHYDELLAIEQRKIANHYDELLAVEQKKIASIPGHVSELKRIASEISKCCETEDAEHQEYQPDDQTQNPQ